MITLRKIALFSLSILLVACQSAPKHAVVTHQQAVASAHPMATVAGLEILNAGGNAFDAAVAVSATLAVVEPYSSGIGGGGFWLLHRASDNTTVMVDGREVAPLKASRDMYLKKNGEVDPKASIDGPRAAGIPGEPAALDYIARHYGKLSLAASLTPAIRAARAGFRVTPHYRQMATFRRDVLRRSPAAAASFLQDNEVPQLGYTITQPELAATLQAMADKGRDGFYRGEVADKLIQGVQQAGGIWTHKDLHDYQIRLRTPQVIHYRGNTITTAALPSSGGIVMAEMFNMLSQWDWQGMSTLQRRHYEIEVMRRAYRDRALYLGDPDKVNVPVTRLTSMAYAQKLSADIQPDKATPSSELPGISEQPGGNHTTHFSIIDKDGNRVSATLSVNYPFGSCFVPPGTGVLLNDEMDDFSAKPGTPNAYGLVGAEANAIAPGKRMLSSMSPTFVENKDRLAIIGTPGGSRIITMVFEGILAFIDGKNAHAIVAQARFHHQYLPDVVQFEPGAFSAELQEDLQFMGYNLRELDGPYGNMQLVILDKRTQAVTAASDPRVEGAAQVE
ncbi:MAG: gamma-glutamyltransferase [Gammaproteobacteria bacterium]|nr:gamma-glutamyltransferase [Gammaproteobacteria bacterium]